MSANLYWKREVREPNNCLGHSLRIAIESYFGRDSRVWTRSDLLFLRGFQSAQCEDSQAYKDAGILIEAISVSEFGIRVWIA